MSVIGGSRGSGSLCHDRYATSNGAQLRGGPNRFGRPWHSTETERFGAGEAIRTPDPDLGKVVLYP